VQLIATHIWRLFSFLGFNPPHEAMRRDELGCALDHALAGLVFVREDPHPAVFRHEFGDALEAWAYRRRRLLRHDWVVYAKTPLGGPAEVLDYLPGSTLMATLPLVSSKKWRWFARDLLGFGYARSRQSLVIPGVPPSLGPLFWGLASFPLAVPVRIRLIPTASTCLALTLRPNKCINPQVHSAPKAV
jgi:hypothetical protein